MTRLFFLFSLFLSLSCTRSGDDVPKPASSGAGSTPASGSSLLSLGDSYTIGEGVPEADRWSVQLARTAGLAAPDIIARTGWTTGELQQAIRAANNSKTYDLVSLLIGVNNQYRRLPLTTYRTEFRELLQTAVRFAGQRPGRVFVLSIPDWGRSPYGQGYDQPRIASEIDQFNAVARDECQQAGVAFVDITSYTRAAAGDASQFAPDGLHYSGKQMQLWAQQASPVVKTLLRNP
ncbi:SGNH/GDSL hydrolase family protein [Hymenobacter lucidus]|uniref:SGNH/GDSL hydrolase family protein n=1 Tax=Hymenobacter lucidus TaxID=2880930 RepID=A0ABS8AMB1_9BACT|nr:SGNH/GDSL hydrolase family protein [Hymenobacter lucidus]MCB2407333.1 SGNH/GDSL hydrolase family protein [Hymenobacter lucidus]